jgi:hypothetical protein
MMIRFGFNKRILDAGVAYRARVGEIREPIPRILGKSIEGFTETGYTACQWVSPVFAAARQDREENGGPDDLSLSQVR